MSEPAPHVFDVLSVAFVGMALDERRSFRQRMWCERIASMFDRMHIRHLRRTRG